MLIKEGSDPLLLVPSVDPRSSPRVQTVWGCWPEIHSWETVFCLSERGCAPGPVWTLQEQAILLEGEVQAGRTVGHRRPGLSVPGRVGLMTAFSKTASQPPVTAEAALPSSSPAALGAREHKQVGAQGEPQSPGSRPGGGRHSACSWHRMKAALPGLSCTEPSTRPWRGVRAGILPTCLLREAGRPRRRSTGLNPQ